MVDTGFSVPEEKLGRVVTGYMNSTPYNEETAFPTLLGCFQNANFAEPGKVQITSILVLHTRKYMFLFQTYLWTWSQNQIHDADGRARKLANLLPERSCGSRGISRTNVVGNQ